MRELPPEIALQLLKDSAFTSSERADRILMARDPLYWLGLAPGLHMAAPHLPGFAHDVSPDAVAAAARALEEEGAARIDGAIPPGLVAALNHGIDRVVAAGWPAVFVFVYDEAWWCSRAPAVIGLVEKVLGPNPSQTATVWVHKVPQTKGASGWPPHCDGDSRSGVNCWIALTDATLDNGCMHVVPRRFAPSGVAARLIDRTPFGSKEVLQLLHGATPMPAGPGDLLAWAFDVLHWGGQVAETGLPARRSLAIEFVPEGEPVDSPARRPTMPVTGGLPSLAVRLHGIASAVLIYSRIEPLLLRFEDVARGLLAAQPIARD